MLAVPEAVQVGVRTLRLLWQRFIRHQGLLRASALSFDTTLGLVPLLALLFVGLRLAGIQRLLEPFLLQQLVGDSQEAGTRMLQFLNNVKLGSLSVFGLAALFLSIFMLLENVREAFNAIWDVKEQRHLLRRSVDYLILGCAIPLLLAVAVGMSSVLQSQELLHWLISYTWWGEWIPSLFRLTSFLCSSLVLMLMYLLLPSAKVCFRSALLGGLLSGAAWQVAHWFYFHFQFGITRYNVLYGAVSLVPFLLIWIYASWLLVLLGLELVRCHQQGVVGIDGAVSLER